MYNKIPLNICCNTDFPFIEKTYDELSTYKMLCKIAGVVEHMQDFLTTINFDEYKKYVDDSINNLKTYVDSKDSELTNYINEQVEIAKQYTDVEISKLNLQLINYINTSIQNLKNYSDNQDNILKNYIDEEIVKIKKEIEEIVTKGIKVYDPTTGTYNFLQTTINNLYTYLRYYGITANEFDSLGLTAQNFDDKLITAREFDLYSKEILTINWCCNMYSPITGEIQPISTIINQLASLHKTEITAQEFDNLDLTAQEFDNKNLTAYQFDWEGKILLSA